VNPNFQIRDQLFW